MQLASYQPNIYLDVAHNEPAAAHLKAHLGTYLSSKGRKVAVIAMLKDKDIEGVLATLKDSLHAFYVATLKYCAWREHSHYIIISMIILIMRRYNFISVIL